MNYYTALITLAEMMMAVLLVLIRRSNGLNDEQKKGFMICALLIALAALGEYLGKSFAGRGAGCRAAHSLAKWMELSVAPAIPVVCGVTVRPIRKKEWIIIPLTAHALLEFASMWLGITFFVDEANVYRHCALYPVYIAAYGAGMIFLVVRAAGQSRQYQNHNALGLAAIMLYMLMGIVWQAAEPEMKIVWLSVATAYALFYVYYNDLVQQIDALTEMLNRRCFENHLHTLRRNAMIIFLDVDGFKSVNDNFGHAYGDACLKTMADIIKKTYARVGRCYRIGGDEFCVIMERHTLQLDDYNAAFTARMRKAREADNRLPIVSCGSAYFTYGKDNIAQVLGKADRSMYEIKRGEKTT